MRIAVTCAEGQVARAMKAVGPTMGVDIVVVGRPALDLGEPASILPALAFVQPDAVVSAAAYTAVEKAESDRDLAFAINGAGAGAVEDAAHKLSLPLLHLSTDYVFNGNKAQPYVETDPTGPTSAYGASKLEGERRVAAATGNHAMFRTAWVYSPYGSNFVKTMLKLSETRKTLSVVADQRGRPTSAWDIAKAMILAAQRMVGDDDAKYRDLFHMTGWREANWAEFARGIFKAAVAHGRSPIQVVEITSDQYPSPVSRPGNSRLSSEKLKEIYGIVLPGWRTSTNDVVNALLRPETRRGDLAR